MNITYLLLRSALVGLVLGLRSDGDSSLASNEIDTLVLSSNEIDGSILLSNEIDGSILLSNEIEALALLLFLFTEDTTAEDGLCFLEYVNEYYVEF